MSEAQIQYYAVMSDTPHGLDDNVNKKLAEGWQLQGGVAICVALEPYTADTPNKKTLLYTWAQAMVKPIEAEFLYAAGDKQE